MHPLQYETSINPQPKIIPTVHADVLHCKMIFNIFYCDFVPLFALQPATVCVTYI